MNASSVFFSDNPQNVMMEVACESNGKCDTDQQSFKGYLSRWMAASIKVAPFVKDWVMPRIQASATAAVATCNGGADGNQCGLEWTKQTNDGLMGVGEQLAVLQVVQANLIENVPGPVTNATGGTSKGNPAAGGSTSSSNPITFTTITTGDKAGAGILTTLVLVGMFGGAWWMAASSK
jgi:mannan endo-1,6-alpha-mannosidase